MLVKYRALYIQALTFYFTGGILFNYFSGLLFNYIIQSKTLSFEIIDYSEKAIALFGDTKAIKDSLSAMGGKFNPRLTHNNEKRAGWIFSKTKRDELNTVLNLNK